jgi:hypothetical protein
MLKPTSLRSALRWSRASYILLSSFLLTILLMGYIWWPLAEEYLAYIDWQGPWWLALDWLLIGIFLAMTLLIMVRADIRRDIKIVLVGLVGGLFIESWGTQTNLWVYYTNERPPLWIIPAWPVASLAIDRLTRLGSHLTRQLEAGRLFEVVRDSQKDYAKQFKLAYWLIFPAFYITMVSFVAPTLDKPLTWASLILCAFLILTTDDHRLALLTFLSGAGLGYFLELWGTTRLCWTYYTLQTPPFFAVLAHGIAAVAFGRVISLTSGLPILSSLPTRFYQLLR